jgi:hypothetical protein
LVCPAERREWEKGAQMAILELFFLKTRMAARKENKNIQCEMKAPVIPSADETRMNIVTPKMDNKDP